jgi:hypothetical protein
MRRLAWVLAEIVVAVALMLSTELVASEQWALNNQSWPTTLWATNATISAAILLGPIYGMLSGVVVVAASTVAKGVLNYDLGRNAKTSKRCDATHILHQLIDGLEKLAWLIKSEPQGQRHEPAAWRPTSWRSARTR